MSPPGRPKGEYRSAQREGTSVSPPGRVDGQRSSATGGRSRTHRSLPVALLVGAAALAGCAVVSAPPNPSPAAPTPVPAATAESPQQRALAMLRRLADKDPHHAGAVYLGAKFSAATGDDRQTLEWLDRLEAMRFDDQLEPTDFGKFADTPAYRERAERFARIAPPVGTAQAWAETRCAGLVPEGTAWDAKRGELLISGLTLRSVVAVNAQGVCRRVVPEFDERLLAVLGMQVDARSDTLWVATAAEPSMMNAKPEDKGTSRLVQIDLAAGKVRAAYPLEGGGMLNDLAFAADGTLYVTDGAGGRVVRLAPGGARLEPVVAANTFEGPNGIVVLANGDLLVADFHGLSRIAAPASATPRMHRLPTPGNRYLGGIDGLARAGGHIVGIQNLVGRARVWSLSLDAAMTRITEARLLLRAHPDLKTPTTGVIVGDRFRFVVDPQLQPPGEGGALSALPAGRTGYRILDLQLNAG